MNIQIIDGPNLNLVGIREPEIYGTESIRAYVAKLSEAFPSVVLDYMQSNHEGVLIDAIQACPTRCDGLIINAGGYTHTSVAIRDAITFAMQQGVKVVEVHISDIRQRETFRQLSLLTDVCAHTIMGHGLEGYREAVEWMMKDE